MYVFFCEYSTPSTHGLNSLWYAEKHAPHNTKKNNCKIVVYKKIIFTGLFLTFYFTSHFKKHEVYSRYKYYTV